MSCVYYLQAQTVFGAFVCGAVYNKSIPRPTILAMSGFADEGLQKRPFNQTRYVVGMTDDWKEVIRYYTAITPTPQHVIVPLSFIGRPLRTAGFTPPVSRLGLMVRALPRKKSTVG